MGVRQHTSRRLDPQLHTHAVIANRVPAPDGRWLALDARTIKIDQRTLSALYHADLRAELTRRLGVTWQPPEHGIAEIAGVDDEVLAEFSQRTRDMDRRLEQKLDRFRCLGREPPNGNGGDWSVKPRSTADRQGARSRPPICAGNVAEAVPVMGRRPARGESRATTQTRRHHDEQAGRLTDAALDALG